jgi:hypothetical protein
VTPEQRRLRAQIAANARWSKHVAREDQAAVARSAIFARLEREVDPGRHPRPSRARQTRQGCRTRAISQAQRRQGPQDGQ